MKLLKKNTYYYPKIIEHLHIMFSCLIMIASLIVLMVFVFKNNNYLESWFAFINSVVGKLMLALILIAWIIALYNCVKIALVFNKTIAGKIFVILEIIFALLIITSFLAVFFCLISYKTNQIYYK